MTQLKDSMSNIEKIRQEIERRKKENMYDDLPITIGRYYEDRDLLAFIDSLLDEKCKENTDSFTSLEEAAEDYAYSWRKEGNKEVRELFPKAAHRAFIAGAEWQKEQMPMPEDTALFQKGVEEGRRLEKDEHRLTWQDIRMIVKIADDLLDDPKARVAFQNHNEEYYYKRVLEQYNNSKDEANSED